MSVKVRVAGVNQALRSVSEETLNKNVTTLLRQLVEHGGEVATDCYKAQTEYYQDEGGVPNVTYNPVENSNEEVIFELTASGNGVLFQEYGTGVGATHPEGTELGYTMDSWSSTHSRKFHDNGYWWYKGKRYIGQPACMGMYNARKDIRNNVEAKAKEVWK